MHRHTPVASLRSHTLAILIVLAALVLAGCGSSSSDTTSQQDTTKDKTQLTVLAAASLTELLPKLDSTHKYQFGGTNELDTQIREGIEADVLVSANEKIPTKLATDNLADKPVAFATNRIVIIVPKDSSIDSLDDLLADKQSKIVMAGKDVPVGTYTRDVLEALNASDLVSRAASFERDVKAVTSKVTLGEADAGFVYITDATAVQDQVEVVELPESPKNRALYMATVLSSSKHPEEAKEFIDLLTSDTGQAALKEAGFGPV